MPSISVTITRFVDEGFPGFVECSLVDANEKTHVFIDKVPIFSTEALWTTSSYPRSGEIRCTIEAESTNDLDRKVVTVSTELPDHVETTTGDNQFVVFSSQVIGR